MFSSGTSSGSVTGLTSSGVGATDYEKPLYRFVTKLEEVGKGGGNYKFQFDYCSTVYTSSLGLLSLKLKILG